MNAVTEHLRLLGDDNRLRILHLLAEEPLTVAELQEVLDLSQSSVSGHLGKLKRAGYLHDLAEGSAHRYRLRDDLAGEASQCWQAVAPLSKNTPALAADRERLASLRSSRNRSWVERVAGHLHREYAPGRSWEALGHAFLSMADLGRCVDVGAGDGAMTELLLGSCSELVCVDPSTAMVAAGEARIRDNKLSKVRYLRGRAQALDLPDSSFDTVCFLQSLQYIDDPAAAIAEALRLLAPGGRLLCLTLLAHDHDEADRFGHVHRGFAPALLRGWCADFVDVAILNLAPETKSPRFTPLLLTARAPQEARP